MRFEVLTRAGSLAFYDRVSGIRKSKAISTIVVPVPGLLILACAFIILQWRIPFYFSQDDNYTQFLPVILHGCRSFFDGIFPTWNPYQHLGAPLADIGVYALTYPPTYLAYGIAHFILGRDFATIDVFIILHLSAGYLVTFALLRRLGTRPLFAGAGALSYALSGYFLIAGASWYYMAPTAFWFPALLLVLERAFGPSPPSTRSLILAGLVIGISFHAGNAQMWVYMSLFAGPWVLLRVFAGQTSAWNLLRFTPALLIGLALAAPLLIPQMEATRFLTRKAWGGGIGPGLFSMFFPYPVQSPHPNDWGSADGRFAGQLYYTGSVFALACLAGFYFAFRDSFRISSGAEKLRGVIKTHAPLCLVLFGFLLALGDGGLLWNLLIKLPVFDQFSNPFKFLAFLNLFIIIAGAGVLERVIPISGRILGVGIFIAAATLLLYHCALVPGGFWTIGRTSFEPLPPAFPKVLGPEGKCRRVLAIPNSLAGHNYKPHFLAYNFASVHGVPVTHGYDPLVDGSPSNRTLNVMLLEKGPTRARRYGISRVLIFDRKKIRNRLWLRHFPPSRRGAVSPVKGMEVIELSPADPLVFDVGNPGRCIKHRLHGAGVDAFPAPASTTRTMIFNFIYREGMRVRGDGRKLPAGPDLFGRIRVTVPPGIASVELRYRPRFERGLRGTVALLLLSTLLLLAPGRIKKYFSKNS